MKRYTNDVQGDLAEALDRIKELEAERDAAIERAEAAEKNNSELTRALLELAVDAALAKYQAMKDAR